MAEAVGAESWTSQLDDLVAELSLRWNVTVGPAYEDATEAYVAEAVREDGALFVIKIHVPRDGGYARDEITTLKIVSGDGCARLVDCDVTLGALLVERLGASLCHLNLSIGRRHQILCDVAQRIWRPAPCCGLPTGREKAVIQMKSIAALWEELGHPCSEAAVAYALKCGERRAAAHDDERAVVVHGDVHQWNTLRAGQEFKLIDPDGGLAEAEYDLGVLMREDPVELIEGDPRERARFLAARCGLEVEAIWEWGVVQRVWGGLLCTRDSVQPFGRQMLLAAEICAE